MNPAPRITQQLKTDNDVNGNPRRLTIVYEWHGKYWHVADVIDQGYRGRGGGGDGDATIRSWPELPTISISPSLYNRIKREGVLR